MTFRTSLLLIFALVVPIARPAFHDNSLSFAATVAGTVIVSKFAYDAVSLFDTYKLPELCNKLFVKQPVLAPDHSINVGLLKIEGSITDVLPYIEKIEAYLNDPTIQGLLVIIYSTGGSAGSSELLYRELINFRKYKPVVVYIDTVCLSAGYMVACGADHIIATSTASVGGIGSLRIFKHFIENPKCSTDKENGTVETDLVHAGKYKTVGNLYNPLTDSDKSYFQELVNKDYTIFCRMVAQARDLSFDERETWADGKEFIAEDAAKVGLIDSCGSWTDAQQVTLELIKKKDLNAHGPLKIVAL